MANYFAFCQEVSPRHTGLVVGILGGLGNLFAAGFLPIAGRIKDATGGFGAELRGRRAAAVVGVMALLLGWGRRCRNRPTSAPTAAALYFLPIRTRMPLKFGPETTTEVTCARVRLTVADARGRTAEGWGETPAERPVGLAEPALVRGAARGPEAILRRRWSRPGRASRARGIPIEVGDAFARRGACPACSRRANAERGADGEAEPMPWLAALVCLSAFDLALHDAYGVLHGVPTYQTYNAEFMNADLARYLDPGRGGRRLVRREVSGRLPRLPAPRGVARLAPGRRQGPARRVGADRRRARRRLSRPAPRLDPPRRPEMPEGQAPRRRPRLGLRPAAPRRPDRGRGGGRLADRRLQLHRPRPGVRQRHPRPAARRPSPLSTG